VAKEALTNPCSCRCGGQQRLGARRNPDEKSVASPVAAFLGMGLLFGVVYFASGAASRKAA